jgi:hypothetical protein
VEKKIMDIIEEVKKINELLRNSRISELCDKIYCLSRSLDKLAERLNYDAFEILFFKPVVFEAGEVKPTSEVVVHLYSCNIKVYEMRVDENTTITELFNKIFTVDEIKERILSKMYAILHEIVREVVLSADLVRRVEEIESKIEEIRRKLEPDP